MELRTQFARRADPERARGAQAYMKTEMPFYGVRVPEVRRLTHQLCQAHPLSGFDVWRDTVLAIYCEASHREEQYAALGVAGAPRYAQHHSFSALAMYRELIVRGSWWDLVDEASSGVGKVLQREPRRTAAELRRWARGENLWLRRAAIICQRRFGAATDRGLLYDAIEASLGSREFFLNKAIGWALRDLAWFDPDEVRRYVRANADRLAPLSRREALKNLK